MKLFNALTVTVLPVILSTAQAGLRGDSYTQPSLGQRQHGRRNQMTSKSSDVDYTIQPGHCEICSKNNKDSKPETLTIEYVPDGKDSFYQPLDKANCNAEIYPETTTVTVGDSVFDLEAGTEFTLQGDFDAFTHFDFSDGTSCFIHTSCSVPLVAGDQLGPFLIKDTGNECAQDGSEGQCVVCDSENKSRPPSLTLEFQADGQNSAYQPSDKASCVAGQYEEGPMTVNDQTFDVQSGTVFTVQGDFGATETFTFSDGSSCFIHTSCSVPIVVGDQIGPFIVLAGNECIAPASTLPPTTEPSAAPSQSPSSEPSAAPSPAPSLAPSSAPSNAPSPEPSSAPSPSPSSEPSTAPSLSPSSEPSSAPSSVPSTKPSSMPSQAPSSEPSSAPSTAPSTEPSSTPSQAPSSEPSSAPSSVPT